MRSKLWIVAMAIAGLVVLMGCGGDDDSGGQEAAGAIKKGSTVKLWIMPNGPDPQADCPRARRVRRTRSWAART